MALRNRTQTPPIPHTDVEPEIHRLVRTANAEAVAIVFKRDTLEVTVDADPLPSLDVLGELTEAISDLVGGDLAVSVSTPGLDAPLTRPHHFARNRGHLIRASVDGVEATYRLGALAADNSAINLIEGKGKKARVIPVELDRIDRATVEIEFSAVPAAEQQLVDADFFSDTQTN
ncbi:MAG: hypothetical protein SPI77_06395 [Corynebacterium sp.]|nr:hypothetical protein [Corynebacterium sp.]